MLLGVEEDMILPLSFDDLPVPEEAHLSNAIPTRQEKLSNTLTWSACVMKGAHSEKVITSYELVTICI